MGVKPKRGSQVDDVVEIQEDWHTGRHIHSGAGCPRMVTTRTNTTQKCTGRLVSHGRTKSPNGVNWRLFRCPHCKSVRFRNPG